MKHSTFLHTATLSFVFCLALAASQAFAQGLAQPIGLAVDASGDLYVANYGQNQSTGSILVYNSQFVLQPSKTITANISKPSGVAIDSQGQIYVSNSLNSSITKYNSHGTYLTSITQNVVYPAGLAIDAFDDVWVNNALQDVTFYSRYGTYLGSSTPGGTIDSICTGGEWYVVGQDATWSQFPMSQVLTNNGIAGETDYPSHNQAVAVAFNTAGNYYVAQETGEVDLVNPYLDSRVFFAQLSYPPTGMVVDNGRGRVFFSDRYGNKIDVYTTKGAYLTTIQ